MSKMWLSFLFHFFFFTIQEWQKEKLFGDEKPKMRKIKLELLLGERDSGLMFAKADDTGE